MLKVAELVCPVCSDRGAMTVSAGGEGPSCERVDRLWTLRVDANRGPYVPTLAALAMIRRFRDESGPGAGALVCSVLLDLADFLLDMEALGIEYWMDGDVAGFDLEPKPLQSSAA